MIKTSSRKRKQKKGNFRKPARDLVGDDALKLEKAVDDVVSNWNLETDDALYDDDNSYSPRLDKEFN